MTDTPDVPTTATVEQVHALIGHDGDERFDDLLLVLAGDEADVTTWQGRRIAAIVATLTDAQITDCARPTTCARFIGATSESAATMTHPRAATTAPDGYPKPPDSPGRYRTDGAALSVGSHRTGQGLTPDRRPAHADRVQAFEGRVHRGRRS
ncbi:hypothetical protein [Actinophytocola sp.]|uniref:hypothetical protein n=1 Tax=Actinophytocola sp. TaxID=1872138 RepID=UPI0038999686